MEDCREGCHLIDMFRCTVYASEIVCWPVCTVRIFRIYLCNSVSLKRAHWLRINARSCFALHVRQILRVKTLILVVQKYTWG